MASRYGRKKRRAHLAKISDLQQRLDFLPRAVRMRIMVGDLAMLDWKYQLSETAIHQGLTDAEIIHVAEQIAVKFHERMRAELGRADGRQSQG